MVRDAEYRVQFYRLIENFIGRKITDPEHEALKKIIVAYVDTASGRRSELETSLQRQGERLNKLIRAMHSGFLKRGGPQEVIDFLRPLIAPEEGVE